MGKTSQLENVMECEHLKYFGIDGTIVLKWICGNEWEWGLD
jgi:hypothetical protein